MLVLILESSTTSAKSMVYDTETGNCEIKVKPYPNMSGDATVHDACEVFRTTMEAGREISGGRKIDMISLVGTWHSLLLCDSDMSPVSPVYQWSYTGASRICGRLREDKDYIYDYYNKTGCMVNAIYPMFKLLHLREKKDLSQYYIMGQGTYSTYRLTGKRVITECMASGTGLFHIHNRRWDEELLKQLGIREEQLCRLISYNKTCPLSKEGAEILGLEEGIPVIPANSDGGLNQLGAGAMKNGSMTFSVGTSGAIRFTANMAELPSSPSTWCYMSPKSYLIGAATSGCCNCIDWFCENFGVGKKYGELELSDAVVEDTPVFLPFLFGERCPGWNDERMGGFVGVRPHHGIKELYRAVQEGILFNLYQCYQELCKMAGRPKCVKLSGGILQSGVWKQMCADIFQKEMEIDEVPHGSLFGGAVLAMELLGVIEDVCEYEVEKKELIKPDYENAGVYQRKYQTYLKYYNEINDSDRSVKQANENDIE